MQIKSKRKFYVFSDQKYFLNNKYSFIICQIRNSVTKRKLNVVPRTIFALATVN